MKRCLLLPVLLLCLLWGCAPGSAPAELHIFAASSLTEPLTELGARYEAACGIKPVFTFDSSGTLKQQIEAGAACDLFVSAAPKQMDELAVAEDATRRDLLENRVVLCVPEGNPRGVTSLDDLAACLRAGDLLLAVGGADVPVGQYAREIFDFYGLEESEIASCLTYGSNAREVMTQVAEGLVDCGLLYETDARAAGLTVVDTADGQCGRVLYPAAVLTTSAQPERARDFLTYLASEDASVIFEKAGFTALR